MGEACPFLQDEIEIHEYPWYALKVRTRSEEMALASLEYHGFESYCPQVKKRRRYSDRLRVVSEAVFPGYLFCRFHLSNKSKVLSGLAVERIVGFGVEPNPIEPSEIDAVRRMVEEGGITAPVPRSGDRVRVTSGSLRGVEGVLVREAGATSFVVSIQLLQRAVSVTVDESMVAGI